jgi:Ni2+-binding GTPase involved in maturation of urease and hydrogenase
MSDGVSNEGGRALRLGVAGPVGTGKSSLIATVCRNLAAELSIAVITNDIYTDEDARFLVNKIDLAAYVEVDVDQMIADATKARSGGPVWR